MRSPSLAGRLPALMGCATVAVVALALWRSAAPWTFTMDTGGVFLGQTVPAFRAWFAGRVPEWSDTLWGGFPLIGDCTSAALYPLHAIAYLATRGAPLRFFDVAFAIHLGIFAAGGAAFVRRLGGSPPAVVLAGVLTALAPFAHYCAVANFPVFGAQAWWPWTFVAVEALGRPATRMLGAAMVLGWISLAAQVLVGVPEQALYCAVPATLWLLCRPTPLPFRHRVARALVLGIGATALAAPQLLPTMLLLPWTQRADVPWQAQLWSMWLNDPTQLLVAGRGVMNNVPGFVGIAAVLLGLAALVHRRDGATFLLVLAALAFALALGPQLGLYELVHHLPPFDHFRSPGKLWAFTEFATIWLAALGADALWRRGMRVARITAAALAVAAIGERAIYLPIELTALAGHRAGDGLFPDRYERLASMERLQRQDSTTPPPVVYDVDGPLGGLYTRNVGALVGIASLHAGSVALLSPAHFRLLSGVKPALLDVLGVRYVIARGDGCEFVAARLRWPRIGTDADPCVFENRTPQPHYALLDQVQPVASEGDLVDAVRRRPKPIPVVGADPRFSKPGRGSLLLKSYEAGRAILLSATSAPALMLARDSFAPGWDAQVDGRDVTPLPAAGVYFAVPVGAGVHWITLQYRAPGLRSGAVVAIAWIALTLVAAVVARRRAPAAAIEQAPEPRQPPDPAEIRRSRRRIVVGLAVLLVGLLGVGEILLRVALFHAPPMESFRIATWFANPYGDDTFNRLALHITLRGREDEPVFSKFDPALGWTAEPRTLENPLGIVTAAPYRLDDVKGHPTILFFGDSFVAGITPPDKTIPYQLGTLLPGMSVFNLGVPAYGLDQTFLMVKRVVGYFDHPFVVVGILFNDVDRVAYPVHYSVKPYFEIERGRLVEHGVPIAADYRAWLRALPLPPKSYVLSAAAGLVRGIATTPLGVEHLFFLHPSETRVWREKKTAISEAVLRALRDECARLQLPLTVVLFPHVEHVVHDGWYAPWLHRVLDDLGITYLDLTDALRRRVRERHLVWSRDVYALGHPNGEENEFFAREIAAFLRQTYGERLNGTEVRPMEEPAEPPTSPP